MSNHSRRLQTVCPKLFIHCGDDPNEIQGGEHDHDKVAFNICFGTLDTEQKQRFAERQKQISLAKQRGEEHIGNAAQEATERRRAEKRAEKEAARNRPPEPEL